MTEKDFDKAMKKLNWQMLAVLVLWVITFVFLIFYYIVNGFPLFALVLNYFLVKFFMDHRDGHPKYKKNSKHPNKL